MTIFCEPKTGGPFDLHTNPPSEARHHICAKCGTTWTDGTPAPACKTMPEATVEFIPLDKASFTKGEILEASGAVQRFDVPRAVLLDPVVRDLDPTEPFFVLRASDLLADYLVEQWAKNAEANGCDPAKVRAAREKANSMRAWPGRRYPA